MNISLIPPPRDIDPELSTWLENFMHQVSGAFEAQEAEIIALKKDVAVLKGLA